MPFRPWEKVRGQSQALLYKLGPTKCILLGSLILFGSFLIQLLTSIGVPYLKTLDFYRYVVAAITTQIPRSDRADPDVVPLSIHYFSPIDSTCQIIPLLN